MTGYLGRFGKVSAIEFLQRDDWYHQMFIVHGGNVGLCSMYATIYTAQSRRINSQTRHYYETYRLAECHM